MKCIEWLAFSFSCEMQDTDTPSREKAASRVGASPPSWGEFNPHPRGGNYFHPPPVHHVLVRRALPPPAIAANCAAASIAAISLLSFALACLLILRPATSFALDSSVCFLLHLRFLSRSCLILEASFLAAARSAALS